MGLLESRGSSELGIIWFWRVNWLALEAAPPLGSGDGADDDDAGMLDSGEGTGVAESGDATAAVPGDDSAWPPAVWYSSVWCERPSDSAGSTSFSAASTAAADGDSEPA